MMELKSILKIGMAVLLFLCLAPFPYGYYQFVRFAGMVVFALLAIKSIQEGKQTEVLAFIILAILFQPIIKIALGRTLWNIVDVLVGLWLLAGLRMTKQKE